MFRMTIAIFLLLWLSVSAYAVERPVTEPDFTAYKELAQTKLDATKESLQKDREKTEVRLDSQDKRIGDLNFTLTMFGAFLTVLGVVAGFAGWVSVRDRAREETRETAKIWFEDNASDLEREIADLRRRVQENHDLVEKLKGEAESHFKSATNDVQANAEATKDQIQKYMSDLAGKGASGESPPKVVDGNALEKMEQKLRNKPEAEYSFDDWNTRAFSAWNNSDFEGAARYWRSAAQATDPGDVQIARTLLNAGITLGQMKRIDEAIVMYDEVVLRFGEATEAALREQVANALVNKGVTLGQMNRNDEEIAVYDEVVLRFGEATEAALREQVATALVNKGITLGQMNRNDEAIAVNDEVVLRFGEATEAALREQVATALVNKGITLGQMKRNDEAIVVYDEVELRFGEATEAALREQVASALNGKGFRLLCRAKQCWADKVVRKSDLQAAATLFERVFKDNANKPMVQGNQAYTAFLLGQPEAARPLLRQALQQGGEELYTGTLGDLDIHPVPLDEEFRDMLETLWAEVKQQGTAASVAAPNKSRYIPAHALL
ncbi:MAG: hypothetical protein HOP24_03655 [Sideroxydans sp.]|nr:hypothetical protein [Sideroxydans sp.]